MAGDPASPIHRLDPRAKILGFAGITVVGVSTPLHAWPAFAACLVALVAIAAVARVGPEVVWSRVKVILPLVVFVAAFVPFVRGGPTVQVGPLSLSEAGLATFALVTAKATIGAFSAVLLGATTSFPDILHGLERLRAPRLLTRDRGVHVPLRVRDRRRGAAHASRTGGARATGRATSGRSPRSGVW